METQEILQGVHDWTKEKIREVVGGENIPALAENLEAWADQKAIATPDTYTDAVRTTGGDIPIETSAGSKLESIKPVAGSRWTAKMLFNGSYNMLNAAKWGAANSQPYVGGVGSNFVYFLVPELTLGTFGTADENNGLLFTDEEGVNIQPATVYYKPLGNAVPSSATDGTSITPTNVSYDGKTYKVYETSGAGWLIVPKTIYDNDVCAHIAWEDWYDKYVSLNEPTTNPEAVVGILILEGLLALAHSDKYLRGVNDEICDNVVFGDTSATITHMVDEINIAANAWTNAATGESDSQGNALYRHSATVSGIKNGGAACVEGEDGGIPLTVNGTTVSYIDTNAAAPASVVFYEVASTSTTKAYTDSVFNGSNINTETGVLPINDCSIEAQVGMDGEANITVKYAKNIVDQVAINATVDVPQIKKQVEKHEERITELEDTAVRTGSYDASVAVGLADNFKGDTVVDAEFYKRKTGGTQSVGSGIAAIKEVRGKSLVWNQLAPLQVRYDANLATVATDGNKKTYTRNGNNIGSTDRFLSINFPQNPFTTIVGHKYLIKKCWTSNGIVDFRIRFNGTYSSLYDSEIFTCTISETFDSYNRAGFVSSTEGSSVTVENDCIALYIDLTLMFGAGNEPATVEEFEKMFPLGYYDYNEGEIIPFAGQKLLTKGFNQFDEDVFFNNSVFGGTHSAQSIQLSSFFGINSANGIMPAGFRFLPNTQYCVFLKGSASTSRWEIVAQYTDGTENKIASISSSTSSSVYGVTSANKTVSKLYYTYGTINTSTIENICINISNPDRNGTYESYEKHTLPLDPSQWRDKNGELVFPYGGMHGVGTAFDYAKVDADGYIRSVVRVFEQVDLGDLDWIKVESGKRGVIFMGGLPDAKTPNNYAVCEKYVITTKETDINLGADKIGIIASLTTTSIKINIKDSAYTDADTFKAAMQGVPLIYELETLVEVELATPVYAKYLVDKDGTEEITPANGQEPYTTPANISILYAMDARGEIKNLPKNYLSKESAENMLNAMVLAGVIASYTMTWDSTNNRYVFVITKPVEESQS